MKMQDDEKLIVSVGDCAHLLGLSRSSCYEGIRRGEIPHLKIGRRILIPKVQLERLLQAGKSDGI